MDEEPEKTKKSLNVTRRVGIVLLGLAILAGAILLVSRFTAEPDKRRPVQPVAIVQITARGFEPAMISVTSGTKVIWTNTDQAIHQVASNPYPQATGLPSLKSEILNNAQSYSFIARKTGSFGYHDQLRPTMNGTLVVREP